MDKVDSKDPFVIVSERGMGFIPNLLPGHLFAFTVSPSVIIDENVLHKSNLLRYPNYPKADISIIKIEV